ncbi:MAG TPA: BON domain-containing protein [Candidatus Binatia bacterium]|nr:BON domain-containing protein [Candidatus Binatia bacterium]
MLRDRPVNSARRTVALAALLAAAFTLPAHAQEKAAEAGAWIEPDAAVNSRSAKTSSSLASDLRVTSVVKAGLLGTDATGINVDTRNGTVTLFGIVATNRSKQAAETVTRNATGVAWVMNQLEVVSSASQDAVGIEDEATKLDVEENLEQHPGLDTIGIEVSNCVVRLTGAVASGVERREAMYLTGATLGVCSVHDALTLR